MEDPSVTDQIITEMKQLKMQGKTYAQAAAQLKETGYSDAQIADASAKFNYDTPVAYKADGSVDESVRRIPNPAAPVRVKPIQKPIAKAHDDKNHPARPFITVAIVILAGILGSQIYRFWLSLHYKHFGADPSYASANNLKYYGLYAVIGMVVAYIALIIYFFAKDKGREQAR